jgi:integrase
LLKRQKKATAIRYVQEQLGHESLAVTNQYLRYIEFEEEKKEVDKGLF